MTDVSIYESIVKQTHYKFLHQFKDVKLNDVQAMFPLLLVLCFAYLGIVEGYQGVRIEDLFCISISILPKVPMTDTEYCNHHPCGWIQYRNGDWNDYDLYHVTTNTL